MAIDRPDSVPNQKPAKPNKQLRWAETLSETVTYVSNQKTAQPNNKLRWAELAEDDDIGGEELDSLFPREVIGPDEKGIKKVIEYKIDDDGKKIKVTTTTQVRKIASTKLNKRALARRSWAKFGDGVREDENTKLTMISTEHVFLERPKVPGSSKEETRTIVDPPLGKSDGQLMLCRTCGRKGDHWTVMCPYRDLAAQKEEERPLSPDIPRKSGAYVPPNKKIGSGPDTRHRNDENAVRVNCLSEDTCEADVRELFGAFGHLTRVSVPVDRTTGLSRGFGYVNFANKEDGQRAIDKLNGYGYDNLILQVEWSKK